MKSQSRCFRDPGCSEKGHALRLTAGKLPNPDLACASSVASAFKNHQGSGFCFVIWGEE